MTTRMRGRRIKSCFATAALFAIAVFGSNWLWPVAAHSVRSSNRFLAEPQTDPGTSLSRGRALLKQGHADQALGLLETALNLYTQANNQRGIAAASDALGDLYLIQ